jgi:hypothetical protein
MLQHEQLQTSNIRLHLSPDCYPEAYFHSLNNLSRTFLIPSIIHLFESFVVVVAVAVVVTTLRPVKQVLFICPQKYEYRSTVPSFVPLR